MGWDEKKVGLILVAVMIVSFVWMGLTGISAGNIIPVAVFSVSLSMMMVLFGDWFNNEE